MAACLPRHPQAPGDWQLSPSRPARASHSLPGPWTASCPSRPAEVTCRSPESSHSLPRHLPRPPSASGSTSPRKARPQPLSGPRACSGRWQPGSWNAHVPGTLGPGRDVRAHGGARLTCSGARDSGQSHCRHRTPPSSAARPSDRAARRPGDRGRGSGRGLLRTRAGLGEWAGTRAGLRVGRGLRRGGEESGESHGQRLRKVWGEGYEGAGPEENGGGA